MHTKTGRVMPNLPRRGRARPIRIQAWVLSRQSYASRRLRYPHPARPSHPPFRPAAGRGAVQRWLLARFRVLAVAVRMLAIARCRRMRRPSRNGWSGTGGRRRSQAISKTRPAIEPGNRASDHANTAARRQRRLHLGRLWDRAVGRCLIPVGDLDSPLVYDVSPHRALKPPRRAGDKLRTVVDRLTAWPGAGTWARLPIE
jgi:hypothetical protein